MPSGRDAQKRKDIDGVPMVLGHPDAVKCANVCGVNVTCRVAAAVESSHIYCVRVCALTRPRACIVSVNAPDGPAGSNIV